MTLSLFSNVIEHLLKPSWINCACWTLIIASTFCLAFVRQHCSRWFLYSSCLRLLIIHNGPVYIYLPQFSVMLFVLSCMTHVILIALCKLLFRISTCSHRLSINNKFMLITMPTMPHMTSFGCFWRLERALLACIVTFDTFSFARWRRDFLRLTGHETAIEGINHCIVYLCVDSACVEINIVSSCERPCVLTIDWGSFDMLRKRCAIIKLWDFSDCQVHVHSFASTYLMIALFHSSFLIL